MLKKMHENTILFEEYEVIKKANDELKVALIEIQQELQRKETEITSLDQKSYLLSG